MDISEDYNDILQACVGSNKEYIGQCITCDSEADCHQIPSSLKTQMKQFVLWRLYFYKNEK